VLLVDGQDPSQASRAALKVERRLADGGPEPAPQRLGQHPLLLRPNPLCGAGSSSLGPVASTSRLVADNGPSRRRRSSENSSRRKRFVEEVLRSCPRAGGAGRSLRPEGRRTVTRRREKPDRLPRPPISGSTGDPRQRVMALAGHQPPTIRYRRLRIAGKSVLTSMERPDGRSFEAGAASLAFRLRVAKGRRRRAPCCGPRAPIAPEVCGLVRSLRCASAMWNDCWTTI
jgi:hypothetical protein